MVREIYPNKLDLRPVYQSDGSLWLPLSHQQYDEILYSLGLAEKQRTMSRKQTERRINAKIPSTSSTLQTELNKSPSSSDAESLPTKREPIQPIISLVLPSASSLPPPVSAPIIIPSVPVIKR